MSASTVGAIVRSGNVPVTKAADGFTTYEMDSV